MYKKWSRFAKEHPYSGIMIAGIVGSIIGITIEYLINQDFHPDSIWPAVTIIIVLLLFEKYKK
ncbi:hypothetical protein [Tetragenococcus halophilus]|uniref:hypothetical protein n=1 Tax=Tetragenococcus halophilus TaxID=51669 RepID=UPI000B92DD2B|nr:hypothetical protein [Tetragenococcus halophilus]GBD60702.1 hypothetical protein TEH11_0385 [Tetragenococcus halophilus subsp. halophilus]GFK23377.1 hypothetical protein YA163_04400 [Tetragenococcus halophilus]GFK28009.1 hypothetical protein YG2_04430 [Tetragenococcus halophilus]GLL50477.1 hypothetical protein YA5_004500 [Tetragenococcus halophilus]